MPISPTPAFTHHYTDLKRRISRLGIYIACSMFFIATMLHADAANAFGGLKILVSDELSQRPLQGAQITVISRDETRRQTESSKKGYGTLAELSPGLYEVLVRYENFVDLRIPSVRVVDNKTTPVAAQMREASGAIEQVIVVGSRVGGSRLEPASTTTLDRESLRSSAGSGSDVLRALDGVPGLFSDGAFSSYTVRGNGPRDNLILVDGIPFDKVVHFNESFADVEDAEGGGRYSVFAPNVIGEAKFQAGGWNSAYGGRAGSLLELNVAEGNRESASYTARLDIAGLELGYDGPSRFHDDTSLLVSARQLNFGRLFETIGLNAIGEPEVTDIIVKSNTVFNDGDNLQFLLIYAPETFERDLENVLASDEDEPGNYEDTDLIRSETDNTLVAATWTHLVGDSGELTQRFFHRYYSEASLTGEAYPEFGDSQQRDTDIATRFPIIDASREESELGWRLDYSHDNALGRLDSGIRLSQLDLSLARTLDAPWLRFEYEQTDFRGDTEQKFIVLSPEQIDTALDESGLVYVLYADQAFNIADIDMRAGLRFESDDILGDSALSPRASTTWQLSTSTQLTLTAGRYLQSPLFQDIASNTGPSLVYEKNDQISAGVKYQFDSDISLFFEPYYQQLSDLVVLEDGVNQLYSNNGEGTSFGFDTAISRAFGDGWSANATYSFNQSHLKDSAGAEKYDADFSRPHAFTIGGAWELNDRWKFSGRWKWASGRPFGDFIVHENVLGDGEPLRFSKETITNNTERYNGYSSLNLRIDYRQAFGPTQIIAFFDVINLLGANNPSNTSFNEFTGENKANEGSAFPLVGFRLEW